MVDIAYSYNYIPTKCSTYSTSPNYVTIYTVLRDQKTYSELVDRHELPLLKQHRWHKFSIPFTVAKYYKVVFQENYGDENHMAVRQIRFLRSIESEELYVHLLLLLTCI